jgi:hypothetical protein
MVNLLALRSFRHARESGHPVRCSICGYIAGARGYWIPAFAGMTKRAGMSALRIPPLILEKPV